MSKQNRKHIPIRVRRSVLERDSYKCVICGSDKSLCLDHIIPHSQDGLDTVENLQVLCGDCNNIKDCFNLSNEVVRQYITSFYEKYPNEEIVRHGIRASRDKTTGEWHTVHTWVESRQKIKLVQIRYHIRQDMRKGAI